MPDGVLRRYGDDLISVKNSIGKGIDELLRIISHIDYVVRRFEEVDNEFAEKFKAASYEMCEILGLQRDSGLFGDFMAGAKSIVSQGVKVLKDVGQTIAEAGEDFAEGVYKWYQDNKVMIDNIASIALETVAIVGAVVTIAACTLTPVGWAVIGAGLLISASNIIDSGVKIYNYTKTGEEKGFNLLESGFKAVLGDKAGTLAYSIVSVATGLYNGKGVTIVSDAKKFFTSVKSAETLLNKADDIGDVVRTVDKLGDAGEAVKVVDKLDDASDAVKAIDKLDNVGDAAKAADDAVGVKGVGAEAFSSNEEAYKYYIDLADNLDVSTAKNTATFYSGPGNRELAESFAKTNGKITLETTSGGKYLDDLKLFEDGSPLTKEQATNVWRKLSERYAKGASGNAYGFTQGSWEGSIFNTVEYPTLKDNPNINNVFTELFKSGGN